MRTKRTSPTCMENLESRQMMSVTAIWDPASFRLSVSGDNSANTITIDTRNSDRGVMITGDNQDIQVRNIETDTNVNVNDFRVDSIYVYGEAGNDTITVNKARRTYIKGGEGHDTIYGVNSASVRDEIYGDAGNDVIYARAGDDSLGGEGASGGTAGNDRLYGGAGNDAMWGYAGKDSLYGDGGNDLLNGDSGDDSLDGGSGDDKLNGDGDADLLTGGSGIDEMRGGSGNDIIFAQDGNYGEMVVGGDGYDVAYTDYILGFTMDTVNGIEDVNFW